MFSFKVLSLAVVILHLGSNSVQAAISKEQKKALKAAGEPFVQECIKEFGFTDEQVEEFKKHHKPSEVDPCFMNCFLKKAEIMNDKGIFELEKATEYIKQNIKNEEDVAVLEKVQQECSKVNDEEVSDGEKGCERAKLLFDCFKSHKEVWEDDKE